MASKKNDSSYRIASAAAALAALLAVASVGCSSSSSDDGGGGPSATVNRTFVEDFRADVNYVFAHGVNTPDEQKLFVAVNEADASRAFTGAVTGYLLDIADVAAGTVDPTSIVTSRTVGGLKAGGPGVFGTVAFRSTFTPDGSKILQAGLDRFLVLDGTTLDPLANDTTIGGANFKIENHDAMPTPDGKYAILALRYAHGATEAQDSGLQLYDLASNTPVGEPVSTCSNCHGSATVAHLTCGIDGSLTGTGPYIGTIYMASGSGGHIVEVPVSIDPTSATPITLTASPSRLAQLSTGTGSTNKTHNFHDVRLDGDKLYYTAIKVDTDPGQPANNNKVHLGFIDLAAANAQHDALLDTTTPAQGAGMVYCGSGQTATHYFPMTMSYPAYIDAIPKADIVDGASLLSQ